MPILRNVSGFYHRDDFERADGAWGALYNPSATANIVATWGRLGNLPSTPGSVTLVTPIPDGPFVAEWVYRAKNAPSGAGRLHIRPHNAGVGVDTLYWVECPSASNNDVRLRSDGVSVDSGEFPQLGIDVQANFKCSFDGTTMRIWRPRTTTLTGQAALLTRVPTAPQTGGLVALLTGHQNVHELKFFRIYKSHVVTMSGVPAGGTAELRNAADALIQSAAEVGGVATFNLLTVSVPYAGIAKAVVKDSGGGILSTYQPAGGVWGGDELEFLGVIPTPVFTAPAAGVPQSSPVQIAWNAVVSPSGELVDYELDYWHNGSWIAISSGIEELMYSWAAAANLAGLVVPVRLRARDTVFNEHSAYAELNVTMAGALSYEQLVVAHNPIEYWRLEETVDDFLTSAPGGFDATAYDSPGVGSQHIISARGVDGAACKGITTISKDPLARGFRTQRPRSPVFNANFSFEQWVKPIQPTAFTEWSVSGITGSDRLILNAPFGFESDVIAVDDGVGIGLQVGTNGACIRTSKGGNYGVGTKLVAPIFSTEWSQLVVVVSTIDGVRDIEIYLNGVHGEDVVGGVYSPWATSDAAIESAGDMMGSWPDYGQLSLNVSLTAYYGFSYAGGIDEVSWYDYPLSAAQIAQHYAACLAEIAAAGAFTAPTGTVMSGSPTLVQWGDAVGADGYLLELWNGAAWEFVATTTDSEYLWTPGAVQVGARLRATGTFGGFISACDPQYVETALFNITSNDDLAPPARRAWAFTLDGHIFYVIGSFNGKTLLYDGTTDQWCRWITGSRLFWNMHRGVMWRGRVLAADRELPIIWELDPTTLLDEESSEIARVVTGFQPHRGDSSVRQGSMRMIAKQQTGAAIDAAITLRFSDDGGNTWSQPRTLDLVNATHRLEFRSLGRIRKPGRIWEISDSGGLIRIDGAETVEDV